MITLLHCNGSKLVERGDELEIFENPILPLTYVLAVVLLRAFGYFLVAACAICGVLAALDAYWSSVLLAALMAAIGVAILAALARQRAHAQQPVADGPSLIIAGGRLLDHQRRDLAALRDVRLATHFQLGSLHRALSIYWPSGRRVIARGELLGESISVMRRALHQRGIPE